MIGKQTIQQSKTSLCPGVRFAKLGTSPGTSGNIGMASYTGSTKAHARYRRPITRPVLTRLSISPSQRPIFSRISLPNHYPSCGSSHTQCVAKTSLCGVRTLVTTQKMEGINKASKSMTVSGSHHPSHKKRSQEWSGWTAYFLLSHRQDNYIFSHATC